jgi:hypothetical protein
LLICLPGTGIVLHVIYDPEKRGDEIIKMLNAHSLLINGKLVGITEQRLKPTTLLNGWINAQYLLSDELISRIMAAQTVGIAMQAVHNAPVFMGFDGMEFGEGREKLAGLVNLCKRPPRR